MPKGFMWVRNVIDTVITHYARLGYLLVRPYANSVFPACTFNFPHAPETCGHTDSGNPPAIKCMIARVGRYNADRSAALVLFDLRLMIRFPAGSLISICSAGMRHGTSKIHPEDSCAGFVQYCAGGLKRHVDYGFKTEKEMQKTRKGRALQYKIQVTDAPQRALEALSLYSKPGTLDADRKLLLQS
jgi:hypothetical protein